MSDDSADAAAQSVGSLHLVVLLLLGNISFDHSSPSCFESSSNLGHSSSGRFRNGGPFIQVSISSGGAPLVKASAGLLSDLIHLNARVSIVFWISATLTETNGLNFRGQVLIQVNTVENPSKILSWS